MSSRPILRLQEAGHHILDDVTPAEARWLMAAGVADVMPYSREGLWEVRPKNVSGTLSHAGLTVEIRPKLPVHRVLWLLEQSRKPPEWQSNPSPLGEDTTLTDAVALLYVRSVEELLARHGLRRSYSVAEETSWTLRGRLRTADQLTRHLGRPLPLEIAYDEFGFDSPAHRILLGALRLVRDRCASKSGATGHDRGWVRRIRTVSAAFEGVSALVPGSRVPDVDTARLPPGYAWPLELARILLDGGSLAPVAGRTRGQGLLLDMPRLFEGFVAQVLGRELGGRLDAQAKLPYGRGSDAPSRSIRPDLVIRDEEGRATAVLDTKYKRSTDPAPADLYQMHVYARMFGVKDVVLVYAEPSSSRPVVLEPATGIRLHFRGIDLSASEQSVLEQVSAVATIHAGQ